MMFLKSKIQLFSFCYYVVFEELAGGTEPENCFE